MNKNTVLLQYLLRQISFYLDRLDYEQTGQDPKLNGYAYSKIPEWVLRQWAHDLKTELEDES